MFSKKDIQAMRTEGKGLLKQGSFWTDVDKEMLKIGYLEGDSISEIALNQGRSESAVMNKLKQLKMLPSGRRKKSSDNQDVWLGRYNSDDKKQNP